MLPRWHILFMLPRWHILFGAAFALALLLSVPEINKLYILLVFLASFLIDFDHYVASGLKTEKWRLGDSFEYHRKMALKEEEEIRKGIRKKSDFHLFHTLEFHLLIALLGIFWQGFFFVFMGMVFHSLLDVISMSYRGAFHRREYFFFNWVKKRG